MSENFKSCFTTVVSLNPHPNPEVHSLEIASVYGFQIVVRKGTMKVGDVVFFTPIDSVLPKDLEVLVFPPDSKMKLHNSRVRQVRIQRFPSQGLLIDTELVKNFLVSKGFNIKVELEKDISKLLGIVKYEEPVKTHGGIPITSPKRLAEHPMFHKYNGLVNIKWGNPFKEDEQVVIQTKLHGSSCRASFLPTKPRNLWQRFLKLINMLPEYSFRYGSNNVDITLKDNASNNFYGDDIYGKALKAGKIESKLKPNEIVYGEVVGENIQKNYHYGHKTPHFVLFDVKVFENNQDTTSRWLTPNEVEEFAKSRDIPMVLVIYKGTFKQEIADTLVGGNCDYFPKHVKEGIVIKSQDCYNDVLEGKGGKKARKMINPAYLDRDNSDFH